MSAGTLGDGRILLPHHRRQLHESGLSDDWIAAECIYSEDDIGKLTAILQRQYPKKCGPALVLPFRDPNTGEHNGFRRVKPDNPRKQGGRDRTIKYESPSGVGNRVYIPFPVMTVLEDADSELLLTEGEKKSIAASYNGFPTLGLTGIYGWKPAKSKADSLVPDLEVVRWKERRVFVVFDSDAADKPEIVEAENRLAAVLKYRGAKVKIVRLPPADQLDGCRADKIGLDDFLLHHGSRGKVELRKLLDAASEPEPASVQFRTPARENDPADLARGFLKQACTRDGELRLRHWRGEFHGWKDGSYKPLSDDDLDSALWAHIDQQCFGISRSVISNARMALEALTHLPSTTEQPAWLAKPPFPASEVLATSSALIHLPSLADGKRVFFVTPTPKFFSATGTPVRFSQDAPEPVAWRRFLASVWPEDIDQIEALQEWFGYCLTGDTRQQKMMLCIGPKRSGKGTVARVLRELLGAGNVAGPSLAGLATNFGLWPLIGKQLAIVSDARLSNRTDRAIVTERLLSVSGEDALTIDRKCLQPITCTLPTRLMLLTNEVPRLSDASGALASRFIILRMTKSFYGKEDQGLTEKLLTELSGILNWAIAGWSRLRDRGYFVQPASSASVVAEMADITSPIGKFVADWCVVDPTAEVAVSRLFACWCEWCESEKHKAGDASTFGRDLSALLPELKKSHPREEGKRVWKYAGIRLRNRDDEISEMEAEYVHRGTVGTGGTRSIGEDAIRDKDKRVVAHTHTCNVGNPE